MPGGMWGKKSAGAISLSSSSDPPLPPPFPQRASFIDSPRLSPCQSPLLACTPPAQVRLARCRWAPEAVGDSEKCGAAADMAPQLPGPVFCQMLEIRYPQLTRPKPEMLPLPSQGPQMAAQNANPWESLDPHKQWWSSKATVWTSLYTSSLRQSDFQGLGEFPGGPGFWTPGCHCWRPGSIPDRGTKIPRAAAAQPKKKKFPRFIPLAQSFRITGQKWYCHPRVEAQS